MPDEAIYTPDMMGANGEPYLSKARLTTEQVNALRAQARVQSVQGPAQRTPTPVNSDEDEMTYEHILNK